MKMHSLIATALGLGLASAAVSPAHAGGALVMVGGRPAVWDTSRPIMYRIDEGVLNAAIDNAAAVEAFGRATDALTLHPGVALRFEPPRRLGYDVRTGEDFLRIEKTAAIGNVAMLDEDGTIIRDLLGDGNERHVIGFASPYLMSSGSTRIGRFLTVMNGRLIHSGAGLLATLVHELGHAAGLDHAQINLTEARNADRADNVAVPTMFPTATNDDTSLTLLNADDIAWLAWLYPDATTAGLYGTLRGEISAGGRAKPGVNVLVLREGTPPQDTHSVVSGMHGDGGGRFELLVPPGTYRIAIEPIDTAFTRGSSVGPYAVDATDLSFRDPVRAQALAGNWRIVAGNTVDTGMLLVAP